MSREVDRSLHSLDQATDVTGLQGRVRLQKNADIKQRDDTWMDNERHNLQAYEYLCHVGEAKEWIEACIKSTISPIETLEEDMRKGIELAKLAKSFNAAAVGKIYEDTTKLKFRHSDNINFLLDAMRSIGLPEVFIFETVDLYEKKNIPKVIYCIHALSYLLAKLGLAPSIKNLLGKLKFTDEQLDATNKSLEESGVPMPQFSNIESALAKELPEDVRDRFLKENEDKIIKSQAAVRSFLARKLFKQQQDRIRRLIVAQAQIRMHMARSKHLAKLKHYKDNEGKVIVVQAHWRGHVVRKAYKERKDYYRANMDSIVKIQAMWKARHAEKAYKSIASLNNPSLGVLQEFLHLLDDSDTDFEEELELERLRQLVVKRIRDNILEDSDVNDLDVKISLLVKNRISLEEVVKSTSGNRKKKQATTESNDPFSLRGRDKETKAKLEYYGQLFYLLQTQPEYLAKLMFSMNSKSAGNVTKTLENIILALYGYAQNTREEYLFLNLIKTCISLEIAEMKTLSEFWKANPLFIKLLIFYTRGAKDRQFLRQVLQPLVKIILNNHNLELETDITVIYKTLIRDEESKTGEKSKRAYDATAAQMAADPEVIKIQAERLEKLKEIAGQFTKAIISSLPKIPYGLRCISMFLKDILRKKFPGNDDEVSRIVGNLIYYRYLNPAIVAPEAFDVIEANISPIQRKNLGDVAKLIHNSCGSRLYAEDGSNLDKLNDFIASSSKAFLAFFRDVSSNVLTAEEFFCTDGTIDIASGRKLTIYISPNEILQAHRHMLENLDEIGSDTNSQLRQILNDIGTPPPAPADGARQGGEINLVLINRFAKIQNETNVVISKKRLHETKRLVLIVVRIQSGKNLLEILNAPVTAKEEALNSELQARDAERAFERSKIMDKSEAQMGSLQNMADSTGNVSTNLLFKSDNTLTPLKPKSVSQNLTDSKSNNNIYRSFDGLGNLTFAQVKQKTLENLIALEEEGIVKKSNNYQDVINLIAKDMLNKHRRRAQRTREIHTFRGTLMNLEEKAQFLADQKRSYMEYVNQCVNQLGKSKKGKKPVMFSKQYYHMRELQKSGKAPKFGSFKWTADALFKKGVLISIDDYLPRQYKQITLTISSDEAGVFHVEASFLGISLPEKMELRLEDLLQQQYNNVQIVTLFDMAKVNLNLLIFLINKKFYV